MKKRYNSQLAPGEEAVGLCRKSLLLSFFQQNSLQSGILCTNLRLLLILHSLVRVNAMPKEELPSSLPNFYSENSPFTTYLQITGALYSLSMPDVKSGTKCE